MTVVGVTRSLLKYVATLCIVTTEIFALGKVATMYWRQLCGRVPG